MTVNLKRMTATLTAVLALAMTIAVFGGSSAHDGHDHGAATPASEHDDHAHDHGNGVSTGVAYLTITNDGDEADRLTGASTEMADVVEIHEMKEENGVAIMQPVADGVEIPAGGEAVLEPNGLHLMLIGLTESLYPNTEYELTLTFEHAGDVTITVPVRATEPKDDDAAEPVAAGDLTIEGAWSRPAPKLDGDATPSASPHAHDGH